MSDASKRLAGILLILFPLVIFGGASLLGMLTGGLTYMQNPLR